LLKEFPTVEDSQKFMESPASADLRIRHHPLFMNYSNEPSPGQRLAPDVVHMDWMCNMCGAINFARRLECYQCCAPRGKDVQRVTNELIGPSNILKVSCLEPHTSENDLHSLFSSLVPVKEVRMVMDKFTSAPRGFAFLHFFSVADASRSLHTFQGCVTETQLTPIKLCYARDRVAPTPTSAAAAAAIEAAQSMQQYASWEPKEFDESATELNDMKEQEQVEYCPTSSDISEDSRFIPVVFELHRLRRV
jgi:RNA-binding protein 5/10